MEPNSPKLIPDRVFDVVNQMEKDEQRKYLVMGKGCATKIKKIKNPSEAAYQVNVCMKENSLEVFTLFVLSNGMQKLILTIFCLYIVIFFSLIISFIDGYESKIQQPNQLKISRGGVHEWMHFEGKKMRYNSQVAIKLMHILAGADYNQFYKVLREKQFSEPRLVVFINYLL